MPDDPMPTLPAVADPFTIGTETHSCAARHPFAIERSVRRAVALSVLLVSACVGVMQGTASGAERVPWTSSRIEGSPEPPKDYHVKQVYPKLTLNRPVELMPLGDTGRMIVLEVGGRLSTFVDDNECEQLDLALDVSKLIDPFQHALGFGLHPDFDNNREVFVVYVAKPQQRVDGTRLSRFIMNDESPPRIDPASEEVLLTWHSGGHNGCAIRFDSNGYLYFSAGDGARPFPPDEFDVSQDLSDLRSTICRIDVDRCDPGRNYAIPPDNPFLDTPDARPEIWAYGFRNPWRFSIDKRNDRLLCGDVGWELWELIFDVTRGGNYGWSIVEGPQPMRDDIQPGPTPILKPLVAYSHAVGQSVTGGLVYHGSDHPELDGTYLYGDYVTGLLWGVRQTEGQVTQNPVLAETGLEIIAFTESRRGETLIVDHGGGIYQLVKNERAGTVSDFPRRLSETGLFDSTLTLRPAPGVYPYGLAAASWHQGSGSDFVVAVPGEQTIRIQQLQRGWAWPTGTVFAKTMSLPAEKSHPAAKQGAKGRVRVETQILHYNGIDWQPYSYAWNHEQTDAVLAPSEGQTIDWSASEGKDAWVIQNRAQCRSCHSRQNGGAVGFSPANLDHDWPGTASSNQLDELVALKILDRRPPPKWNVRAMVDPSDTTHDLDQRARSYLVAHCAHCHRRGGGGTVPLDLTFSNPTSDINAVDVAPVQGAFGIDDAKVIVPGEPWRSVLFYRMATSGAGHMPKLGARDNDLRGLQLIHDWISSLNPVVQNELPVRPEAAMQKTTNALRLLSPLLDADAAPQRRHELAAVSAKVGNPLTAALFERFLPADQRRKTLGASVDPQAILAVNGDATHGREIFIDARQSQCANCHRVQGSGKSVGPDLDGIGKKRSRLELLESILDPSKVVEAQFRSHIALTDDGTVVTGLKVDDTADALVLRQANGVDMRIEKESLESARVQPQSLMPAELYASLTAQELADLLAFLVSLK